MEESGYVKPHCRVYDRASCTAATCNATSIFKQTCGTTQNPVECENQVDVDEDYCSTLMNTEIDKNAADPMASLIQAGADVVGAGDAAAFLLSNKMTVRKIECACCAGITDPDGRTVDPTGGCKGEIQLVGFIQNQIDVRVQGHMSIFGNEFRWDERFDLDELLDAAEIMVNKIAKLIMDW